jgi:hypothetical protein
VRARQRRAHVADGLSSPSGAPTATASARRQLDDLLGPIVDAARDARRGLAGLETRRVGEQLLRLVRGAVHDPGRHV